MYDCSTFVKIQLFYYYVICSVCILSTGYVYLRFTVTSFHGQIVPSQIIPLNSQWTGKGQFEKKTQHDASANVFTITLEKSKFLQERKIIIISHKNYLGRYVGKTLFNEGNIWQY